MNSNRKLLFARMKLITKSLNWVNKFVKELLPGFSVNLVSSVEIELGEYNDVRSNHCDQCKDYEEKSVHHEGQKLPFFCNLEHKRNRFTNFKNHFHVHPPQPPPPPLSQSDRINIKTARNHRHVFRLPMKAFFISKYVNHVKLIWPFCSDKLRASCFHHLQTWFVEGNVVRQVGILFKILLTSWLKWSKIGDFRW